MNKGVFYVSDLGSRFGTLKLASERRHVLDRDGAMLQVGNVRFDIIVSEAEAPSAWSCFGMKIDKKKKAQSKQPENKK